MAGFTTGLTRIKRDSEDTTDRGFQEQQLQGNPVGNEGMKVSAELDELQRVKTKLSDEIEETTKQRDSIYRQHSQEIRNLSDQKSKLVRQVKDLGKLIFILKRAKDSGRVSFEDFFANREDTLVGFSSLVTRSLDRRAKLLKLRADAVVEDEGIASEMAEYAEKFLEGAENRLQEVVEARKSVNSEAKRLSDLKGDIERNNKEASKALADAKSKLANATGIDLDAKDRLKEAELNTKVLIEGSVQKVNKLRRLNNKLKARSATLKEKEDRLSKWETRLKDWQETLTRTSEEVRKLKSG